MRKRNLVLLAVLVSLAILPLGAQVAVTVELTTHETLGPILTDADGMTMYLFTVDKRNVSKCAGGCANAWPPVLASGDPAAGEGVTATALATITRDDGGSQVTYNGWPLYYFAFDNKPGDTNGQDSRGVWYTVSTDGGAIWSTATLAIADHPELGAILSDSKGRILYLFSPDLPNKSVCAGGCALAWPPVVTIDAPLAGDGVDARQLGTITRDDGYTQVTYGAQPLYYLAFDGKPGDARGQDSGNAWFVLSAAGSGIVPPVTGGLSLTPVALLSTGGFMLRRRALRHATID